MVLTVSRFLARERERGVLRTRLAGAVNGRGGVVAISGPVGIGGTSLARETVEMARVKAMAIAWGECREGLLDRPYGALAEALESGALAMPTEQVIEDLGSDAGPILRICPGIASVLPTIVPAVPLEPADERLRLREAIANWVTRLAARAPLLVVMDEFQLADGDLRGMVEHLNRRLRQAPVLLVTVSSIAPTKVKTRKRVTKPKGVVDALELEGLDEGAVAALLSATSGKSVAPATVAVIQEVAYGNALLSIELHRHMLAEGLVPAPGSARVVAPGALPQTLDDVIAWRTSRLEASSRAALNVLAAFPRGASAPVVATVAGLVRGRAADVLDGLVASGLATIDQDGGAYSVVHPVIRVALLDQMTPVLRAQLHRRIAEVLDANAGDDRRQKAGEIAHYWLGSNTIPGREKGLSHFLLATEQARAAYAHERAVNCLRAALTLAPEDHATTFDLTTRLAVTEAAAGLRRDALASARRVLELGGPTASAIAADRDAPSSEAFAAVTETLRTMRADGMDPEDGALLEPVRALALAMLGPDRSPRSDSLPHLRFKLLAESWVPATLGGRHGVNVLVWSDVQAPAAAALLGLGNEADKTEVMLLQRPRDQVETALAAEAAKAWRRPTATLRALASATTDLVTRLGLFGEGSNWASQYVATADRFGSPRDRVRARTLLARCQIAQGAFSTAQESIDAAAALLPTIENGPMPSANTLADDVASCRLSLAHFVDGDWRALLKELPPTKEPRSAGLLIGALRSVASKRAGKGADAAALVEALVPGLTEVEVFTLYRDAALVLTVAAMWELGAAEHAAAGLSLFNLARNAGVGGQPEASLDLTEARLLALAGRVNDARIAFAAARATASSSGLKPQLALIDYDEAIAIAAAGPRYYGQALNLLSGAKEKFDRLGMEAWSERASALNLTNFKDASTPGGRLFFTYPRGLSRREADVVRLLASGAKPTAVATELELDKVDLEKLTESALKKLRGKSADELPQLARKYGLGGL